MGWGLDFKADIFISRTKKPSIQDEIDDNEEQIKESEERLMVLAASTPRDIKEDGDSSYIRQWHDYVITEVKEEVHLINEATYKNTLLRLALENIDNVTEN